MEYFLVFKIRLVEQRDYLEPLRLKKQSQKKLSYERRPENIHISTTSNARNIFLSFSIADSETC